MSTDPLARAPGHHGGTLDLHPKKAPKHEAHAVVPGEKPANDEPVPIPAFRFAKVFWIWAASATPATFLLLLTGGVNDMGGLIFAALALGLTVAMGGAIVQKHFFDTKHTKPRYRKRTVRAEWLEQPRKASFYGRLIVVIVFIGPWLVFRFTGKLFPFPYLVLPMLLLGVFYWLGKTVGAWFMRQKFATKGLVDSLPWVSFIGLFFPIAGAFMVGASFAFNRSRKDTPLKFVFVPMLGLIVAILSALAAIHAKHGRL